MDFHPCICSSRLLRSRLSRSLNGSSRFASGRRSVRTVVMMIRRGILAEAAVFPLDLMKLSLECLPKGASREWLSPAHLPLSGFLKGCKLSGPKGEKGKREPVPANVQIRNKKGRPASEVRKSSIHQIFGFAVPFSERLRILSTLYWLWRESSVSTGLLRACSRSILHGPPRKDGVCVCVCVCVCI